jgi:hypothetical protein
MFSFTETNRPAEGEEYQEPIHHISYWWSSCYSHPVPNPNPSSVAISSHGNYGSDKGKSLSTSNPGTRRTHTDPIWDFDLTINSGIQNNGVAPTFLLDAALRKQYAQSRGVPVGFHHRVHDKLYARLRAMGTSERLCGEEITVRSCLSAGVGGAVSFSSLLSLIGNSRFHDPKIEACRMSIGASSLKNILHRLEERGEVDVTVNVSGDISIMALSQNVYDKSVKRHSSTTVKLPIKLRKFACLNN